MRPAYKQQARPLRTGTRSLTSQTDVMFQDNKGKTLMNVMPSRVQTRDEADGLREAWGEALDKLKVICEE